MTESGEEIEADAVVRAGACVAPLAASAGVYIPVQPLRGYSLTARVVEGAEAHASKAQTEEQTRALEEARSLFGLVALLPPPKRSVLTHLTLAPSSLYVTRLGDELRFTCYGEFCPVRADGTGPPNEELQAALRELVEAEVPNVRELCIWDHAVPWCGARPLTPDCYPISGDASALCQRRPLLQRLERGHALCAGARGCSRRAHGRRDGRARGRDQGMRPGALRPMEVAPQVEVVAVPERYRTSGMTHIRRNRVPTFRSCGFAATVLRVVFTFS